MRLDSLRGEEPHDRLTSIARPSHLVVGQRKIDEGRLEVAQRGVVAGVDVVLHLGRRHEALRGIAQVAGGVAEVPGPILVPPLQQHVPGRNAGDRPALCRVAGRFIVEAGHHRYDLRAAEMPA